jgi:hypothetical protein
MSDWLSRNTLDGAQETIEIESLYYLEHWQYDTSARQRARGRIGEKTRTTGHLWTEAG